MQLAPAASIEASRIRAIADLADRTPGTLRLFYGEDTLPTPDFIKEAAKAALDADRTYYTPNLGYSELRQEIAEQVQRLHQVPISPDEVVVTASGMMAIHLAVEATIGPGDSALVLSPLWPNFVGAIRVAGAEPIEVPLAFGADGFTLDLDRLEAAVRSDSKLLALASPGNPTGWTATPAEWESLVEFCERHDLWLLADGVYERIVFDSERQVAPSPLAIPDSRCRTIIAQSFSKSYRMTGWRVGYAIVPPALATVMAFLQEYAVSHAFGVAQEAARAAITLGEPFLAEARQRYVKHRDLTVDRLGRLDRIQVPIPSGAFYVFPKLEGLADSMGFCEAMVRDWGVGLAPGAAFGAGGEGHVRLCFAVDEETLLEALRRLEAGWQAYQT